MKRTGSDRKEVEDEKVIQFDADHHINAFEEVFNTFKLAKSVKQWTLCHTADSAPVNPSIAHKMGHSKHISCKNHNLNLEGKLMIEKNVELKHITDKIDLTSAAVRSSCKISTSLRRETALDNPKV